MIQLAGLAYQSLQTICDTMMFVVVCHFVQLKFAFTSTLLCKHKGLAACDIILNYHWQGR